MSLDDYRDLVPIRGGQISRAFRATAPDGRAVFLKTRDDAPPGMFAAEVASLRWLRDAGTISVPRPIECDDSMLALEWVEPGVATARTAAELGIGLAGLHRSGAPTFGLSEPANLATIPLDNEPTATWAEFYWSRRLEPLLARATDAGELEASSAILFERIEARLDDLCGPPEPVSRLHGDLWSGNVMVGPGGHPWLVDPSSYGGHREVDLAMLDLFGGLDPAMVDAYDAAHPLTPGWRERLPLWQLLPLLVHTVLFGGSYGAATLAAARRVLSAA